LALTSKHYNWEEKSSHTDFNKDWGNLFKTYMPTYKIENELINLKNLSNYS